MSTRSKLLLALVVIVVTGVLAVLVGLGLMGVEPLIGLLGVITGALISVFSTQHFGQQARRHQLRLAALDRRLQAHQEAFALWRELLANMNKSDTIGEVVDRCQDWWDHNCLYLTPEARQAFAQAYLTAHTRHVTLMTRDVDLIRAEFEVIKRAGDLIVQGVELPTIAEGEQEPISPEDGDA